MKRRFYFTLAALSTIFVIGCSDESIVAEGVSGQPDITLRSSYDNYFNYEDSAQVIMTNEYGVRVLRRLPWQYGVSNSGIPSSWIDPNIESGDKSLKKYTKQRGWELVYSNLRESTSFKYIGLYNKYTGMMRFFMCIFAEPGGSGASSSIWGVRINNSTSLLNFTNKYSESIAQQKSSPLFVTTPTGSFAADKFSGAGLQNGSWCGFEFICAYDPSVTNSNTHEITLMGRAIDQTLTVGNINSKGDITGTITGTIPTSTTTLSFSNMFNNTSTDKSINVDNEGGVVSLGETIDNGIAKNDSFFKGLWNNIKSNASSWISSGLESGAKKGLEAIMTQGGSVVGDAIGGLFNSLIGGGSKQADLKVDLDLTMNSTVDLSSVRVSQGWSDVTLPLPGSQSSSSVIYNKTLGVWNLQSLPVVDAEVISYTDDNPKKNTYQYAYYLEPVSLNINPEIKDLFKLENFKQIMILKEGSPVTLDGTLTPYAYLDSVKYYAIPNNIISKTKYTKPLQTQALSPEFLAFVSFDLVHKTTNEKYSFARYFKVDKKYIPY